MPVKAKARAVLLQDFGYNNFSSDDEAPTPRLVIANVGNENYSKRAFMHAHSPLQDTFDSVSQDVPKRPSTAGSGANRDRKLSVFSRPLTTYEYETRKRDSSRPSTASGLPRSQTGPNDSRYGSGIGVALGSPTGFDMDNSTLDNTVHRPLYSTRNDSARTLSTYPSAMQHDVHEQRPKPKRWKSVSNLFSRKKSSTSKTPPTQTPEARSPYPESISDQSQQSGKSPASGRSRSGSKGSLSLRRSKPKMEDLPPLPAMPVLAAPNRPAPGRPELAHSLTAPAIVESIPTPAASPLINGPKKPAIPAPRHIPRPEPNKSPEFEVEQPTRQLRKRNSRPQLDVEIPQTRFERFSVMFSDLQSLNNLGKAQARTSIIGRRNRTSKLIPLATLAQDTSSEHGDEPMKADSEPVRPQTAPAPEIQPAESVVADVPLIAPTPRRAASTKSLNKGPAYSLFPRTSSKTPKHSITLPSVDALPLHSNPNPLHRASTTIGFVSPPPTFPPPALPVASRLEVSSEIDDMIDFLESASSDTTSPPATFTHPNPLNSHSTYQAKQSQENSHAATPPDSPVLKAVTAKMAHSDSSTPRQHDRSPALRSSSVQQQTLILPPSPVSSSTSGASSPTGTAPSTAGTAPSERDAYHTPQTSSSFSSSQPQVEQIEGQDRTQATSLRRGGRDVNIVSPHAYVLSPPLAHSATGSRNVAGAATLAASSSPLPKRTSSLSPFNLNSGTMAVNADGQSSTMTANPKSSILSSLSTQNGLSPQTTADSALSASSLSPIPSSAQTPSLGYGYDAEHSPLLSVAQTASVVMGAGSLMQQSRNSDGKPDPQPQPQIHKQKYPKPQKSRIPINTSSATSKPVDTYQSRHQTTYLDDESDLEPPVDLSSDDDYSDEEERSEDDIGRKSNEGIVRARTPTFVEVDGNGGVIGLGLTTGLSRLGDSSVQGMGKSSGSLRRGRSVEGLLEVA